ncbi:hypothetical protein GCM10018793_24600 [Streptomyces sulfonofaciens]|uniref:Uncharacterized protein n=1 Tax=Streptomyces sulfonofaciens TaxID=68272 RepID=A0A919G322_9ACTN|nr:hypothetical protein GCM10018793_24600 [Streptomyces sulfonofaciens]
MLGGALGARSARARSARGSFDQGLVRLGTRSVGARGLALPRAAYGAVAPAGAPMRSAPVCAGLLPRGLPHHADDAPEAGGDGAAKGTRAPGRPGAAVRPGSGPRAVT